MATASLHNNLGGAAGFGENSLIRNDDTPSGAIDVTSVFGTAGIRFGSQNYTQVFINNNGMITFGAASSSLSGSLQSGVTSSNGQLVPAIAAFWTDIDTRFGAVTPSPGGTSLGTNLVYWDIDSTNKKITFTWDDVGSFPSGSTPIGAFQIRLSYAGAGNLDIEIRYEFTADSRVATAGWNAGVANGLSGIDFYEIAGGSAPNADLDTATGSSGQTGVWNFALRGGVATAGNTAPQFVMSASPGGVAYTENASAIALDGAVAVVDAELAALNGGLGNYAGASVTLARQGGASTQDVFSARGNLSFSAGNALLLGSTVGTVSNSAGTLAITFNSSATQAVVNQVLSSIGYANSSDAPPASVRVGWTFRDGNTTASQGTGGVLTGTGSTMVNITAVNDAPTGGVTITGIAATGQTLTAVNTLADADGLGAMSYQWKANGVNISGATGAAHTLGAAENGKQVTVQASYTDGGGTQATVTSAGTQLVVVNNTSPQFSPSAFNQGIPGTAIIPVGNYNDYSRSVTLQPDGKILVAGTSYGNAGSSSGDFSLIRLNADGSLDTSFNGIGKAIIPVGSGDDRGGEVTLQSDGKIVVAGYSFNGSNYDFSLIRLNANGSLDTSFNGSGKAIIPVGNYNDYSGSVTLQPDGKIVLAGTSYGDANYGGGDFSLVRLNANGSLDTSFNGSGKAIIPVGNFYDDSSSVTLQPDGKIVVAGTSYGDASRDFSLVRLNANGSLDTSFNGSGKAIIPVGNYNDYSGSVTLQPDGKIVLAGTSYGDANYGGGDFSLIRLNANGSLDTSFNGSGKAIIPVGTSVDASDDVTIQPDGKIVVAGTSYNGGNSTIDCSLIRLNANGSLDTSFNGSGKAIIPVGWGSEGARVTLQPDGKIVVAGSSFNGSNFDFSLIRLNVNGNLDTNFNDSGSLQGGGVVYVEDSGAVALARSVTIVDAELAALSGGAGNYAGASVTLARHGGANPQDLFSALGNLSFSAGNALLSGSTVGTVSNSAGTLAITFNSNATQAVVNQVLSSIGYANSSDRLWDERVQVDWTFSDGNTAASQGPGGVLTGTGSSMVYTRGVDDAPTGAVTIAGVTALGQTLTAVSTLDDADGTDGYFEYQWLADGVTIDGAQSDTYTVGAADLGKTLRVQLSYLDFFLETSVTVSSAGTLVGNTMPQFIVAGSSPNPGKPGTAIIPSGIDDINAVSLSVAVQPDGKIVVAGWGSNNNNEGFSLIRLNADSSLDTSFNGSGRIIIPGNGYEIGQSLTLQPDGKIVVAGTSFNPSGDFNLIRLNANGSLDTSFNGSGTAIIPVGSYNDSGRSVTLQPDGKIVVAGYSYNGSNNDFSLIRLNANGSLDTSFNGSGKAIIPVGNSADIGYSVNLLPDGKIVVAGVSNSSSVGLVRLNTDGSLDTSFNGSGKALIPVDIEVGFGDGGQNFTLQPDGKMLVAGIGFTDFGSVLSLIRLNTDGTLDTSFNGSAKASIGGGGIFRSL